MQRWEYKTIKVETLGFRGGILDTTEFNALLNQLGLAGWELVSTVGTAMGNGASREVVAIFKRMLS